MSNVQIEIEGLPEFLKKLDSFQGASARKKFGLFLEQSGYDFIDVVQDTIISMGVVDTRRLLNSFDQGGEGNIWRMSNAGLTLEIGTNLKYAQYVNDGHFTTRDTRWVPGKWKGDRFIYSKTANTGMLLRRKWVGPQPYFDKAVLMYEQMFGQKFQKFVDGWIAKTMKG